MPVKFFCDECGVEVDNPAFSLDMTGKILCSKCFPEKSNTKYSISWKFVTKKPPFPFSIKRIVSDKGI